MFLRIYNYQPLTTEESSSTRMLNAAVRSKFLLGFPSSQPTHVIRKVTGDRFTQASAGKEQSNKTSNEMDKQRELPKAEKTRDAMSSFGEGYATRSDEEGFGGVYSGNQSVLSKEDEEKIVHANKPDYDRSQGSEVKEMERARNQHKVAID